MTEPFPPLNGAVPANIGGGIARRRRKSSGLGADLPGDVDVPSFATSRRVDAMADNMKSPVDARSDKPRRSKRRTVRRGLSKFKRACVRHTWLLPLLLLLAIVAAYLAYPHPSNPLSACLFLSYPLPRNDPLIPTAVRADPNAPTHYGKGGRDFAFVGFYIIVLSFTREFCMQRLIRPIAIACGIKGRAKQSRFMEQAYTALYFGLYGPFGIWVMSRSPVWYFDTTEGMYAGFPHRTHEAVFKAYYLLQASYWAQQAIVLLLMLEKPRKDFKELVAHHIITLALIWLSYRFHFTYMGIAVYITHDVSDFFLATSKILNYIDSPIVGPYFFVFMCVWGYLRHFINIKILYSILTSFRTVGPFDLNWETQQYKCWISQYITFALLAALQAVNLFWWFFICRIAYRFIVYKDADDDRSEYEPSEGEEAERKHEIQNANAESELVNAGSESPNGNGVKRSISNVDAPSTPVQTNAAKEPETIGSRVKQRKKGGQS